MKLSASSEYTTWPSRTAQYQSRISWGCPVWYTTCANLGLADIGVVSSWLAGSAGPSSVPAPPGAICDNSKGRYSRCHRQLMTRPSGKRATSMANGLEAVRPIEPASIPDRVTAELRRSILRGDLAPGQTFSLREIAGRLGVSFIPVREALRNLEGEGLVVMHPGRSAMVAPLDLDDLHAIYRLRRTLEPELARRSCLLVSDEELTRLRAQATGFGEEHRSMDDIYEGHLAFHLALFAPAATAWDERILLTLWRAAGRALRIRLRRPAPGAARP